MPFLCDILPHTIFSLLYGLLYSNCCIFVPVSTAANIILQHSIPHCQEECEDFFKNRSSFLFQNAHGYRESAAFYINNKEMRFYLFTSGYFRNSSLSGLHGMIQKRMLLQHLQNEAINRHTTAGHIGFSRRVLIPRNISSHGVCV